MKQQPRYNLLQWKLEQSVALIRTCILSYTRLMKKEEVLLKMNKQKEKTPLFSSITEIYSLSSRNCAGLLQNGWAAYFS
jgi:hypothetical protein